MLTEPAALLPSFGPPRWRTHVSCSTSASSSEAPGAWGALQSGFLLPIPGTVGRALLRIAALLEALQTVALVMLVLDTTRQRAELVRGFNQTLLGRDGHRAGLPGARAMWRTSTGGSLGRRARGATDSRRPASSASTGETDGSS